MLRSIFIALAVAAALFAFGWLGEAPGGALVRAANSVAIGVLVATIMYGQLTWVTVSVGALSPLAFSALERHSLGWATAAMCFAWIAPRFVLAPTPRMLAILVAAATTAALVGGFVFAGNIDGPLSESLASCVFAGSCLSLVAILIPVDTTIAWSLKTAAAAIGSPARAALERAARAHRQAARLPEFPSKQRGWRSLALLADRRASIERMEGRDAEDARRELDERIAAQVAELAPSETSTPKAPDTEIPAPTEPEITVVDDATEPAEPTAAAPEAPSESI